MVTIDNNVEQIRKFEGQETVLSLDCVVFSN
jgi:hypothetical protein